MVDAAARPQPLRQSRRVPELKPGKESYRVVRGPQDAGALSDCMPIAGPAAYTVPYQFQLVQNANYVLILHEYPGVFRIVPLPQGNVNPAHPVDPDPTWMGDSVGRWEGDTLVVDTVGFNTRTELSGYKHSEGLHIVEKSHGPTPTRSNMRRRSKIPKYS